ncbi:MAG: CvpA family protein [Planctomycetota bacterium]
MLSLLIIVLIAAIVFFQAIHGLFSSLIMALCTLVCTLLAFTYYEPLARLAGLHETQPAYGEAIMLVALLVIPLFVLRFLVDNYLPGNVVASMWADRIGGAAFGLVTALLLVGTLVIAMQMLPFDRAILGWDPYTDTLAESDDALLVDAPAFTRGVVRTLSAGSLGRKPFDKVHEDLRLELWAVRNRDEGARTDAAPDAARLLNVTDVTDLPMPGGAEGTYGTHAPGYPGVDTVDSRVYLVRVQVTDGAMDSDRKWRLRGTHFRLVTDRGDGYYPVGYLVYAGQWQMLSAPIGELQITREYSPANRTLTADLLFRVPDVDGETPELARLTFRRSIREPVRDTLVAETTEQLPDITKALSRKEVRGEVAVASTGPPSVFRPVRAIVSAASPARATYPTSEVDRGGNGSFRLAAGGAVFETEMVNYNLKVGRIEGPVPALMNLHGDENRYMPADSLHVPAGQRLVRLEGRPLSDTSLARLLRPEVFVQARIHLLEGEPRQMVGAWVKWTENGVEHAYLYYNADRLNDSTIDYQTYPEEEALDALKRYKEHLGSATDVGLLFLVPQDATVVRFNIAAGETFACESPMTVRR